MRFPKCFPARRRRRPAPLPIRPGLEPLECRELPATFTVTDLGDAGRGSGFRGDLRYAITQADNNRDLSNHIQFQPGLTGTIRLTQGPLAVTKDLVIDGPGQELLTVSGDHQSGVFAITSDPRVQTVRLADLTIADGVGDGRLGGGLYNDHAAVTLTRVTVSGNSVAPGGQGGGIYNNSGALTLDDSTVADNQAALGGGIYDLSGNLTLHSSAVVGNTSASTGGGIYAPGLGGALVVDHSTISRNTGQSGAGIFSGPLLLSDSTVADNIGGAGIYSMSFQIERSTISGNVNPGAGGGIEQNGGPARGVIDNSTIVDNTASFGGGVLVGSGHDRDFVTVTHSTIVGNHAVGTGVQDEGGGGIYVFGGSPTDLGTLFIGDSVVAGNDAPPFTGPDVDGPVVSLRFNFIGVGDYSDGWSTDGQDMDHVGTSDNPLDSLLGPLQDNGGPTLTRAPLPGSPLLTITDYDPTPDQRGSVRLIGHPGAVAANRATAFRVSTPFAVVSGQPFALTVTAVDPWGNTASTYAGTVHFSSTDLDAQLPDDYTFDATDGGTHAFTVVLQSAGLQSVAIQDNDNAALAIALDLFVASGQRHSGFGVPDGRPVP